MKGLHKIEQVENTEQKFNLKEYLFNNKKINPLIEFLTITMMYILQLSILWIIDNVKIYEIGLDSGMIKDTVSQELINLIVIGLFVTILIILVLFAILSKNLHGFNMFYPILTIILVCINATTIIFYNFSIDYIDIILLTTFFYYNIIVGTISKFKKK